MAVPRSIITPEEGAELTQLQLDSAVAIQRERHILATGGMESPEFLEATKASGAIIRRIREIQGTTGTHWMA
jgi:hypothetical protein